MPFEVGDEVLIPVGSSPCVVCEVTETADPETDQDGRATFHIRFVIEELDDDAWPSIGLCPHHENQLGLLVQSFREGKVYA